MNLVDVKLTLALLAMIVGCHRGPADQPAQEACVLTCESFACLDPQIDAAAVARCESYCLGKSDASEAQGADCAQAYSNAMMCLAELSCSEYDSWLDETPNGPCPSARSQVDQYCDQIFLEPHFLPPP